MPWACDEHDALAPVRGCVGTGAGVCQPGAVSLRWPDFS